MTPTLFIYCFFNLLTRINIFWYSLTSKIIDSYGPLAEDDNFRENQIFVKIKFSSNLLKYDSKNFLSGPNFLFQIIACKVSYNLSIKMLLYITLRLRFFHFTISKNSKTFKVKFDPVPPPTPPPLFFIF